MSALDKALEDVDSSAAIEELKAAHNRALKALAKQKLSEDELVDAVYRAAKDAAAGMVIKPVPTPKVDKRKQDPEVAVLCLADWQIGKITPTYSTDVAAERVKLLAKKVARLVEIQRADHPVKELRIYLLGDLVEGEDIFPGQAHLIDASLYTQIFRGAEMLAGLVRDMAAVFEKVKVVGVIGNHGRLGRRGTFHPESNGDAIMYRVAAELTKSESRVEWVETFMAGERAWYATDEVLGKKWFLFHGDQLKGGAFGFPWYSLAKRATGWHLALTSYDYSAFGHWHTPVRVVLADGKVTSWGSGSIESTNTYAQEWVAASGSPAQWLLFQHADGVTAEYLVRLD